MQIHFLWWHHLNLKTKVKLIFIPFPWKQFWPIEHWYQYSLVLDTGRFPVMWPWRHKTWAQLANGQGWIGQWPVLRHWEGETGFAHKSKFGAKDYTKILQPCLGKVLRNVLVWSWVTGKFRERWCDGFSKTMLVGGSDITDQWELRISVVPSP